LPWWALSFETNKSDVSGWGMGPIMFAVCVALQVSFLRKFYPPRCISSEPSIDSEGGQDEDQCVDDGPDEGDPGRHLKVTRLIHASESEQS
jgi:hypothetical protein